MGKYLTPEKKLEVIGKILLAPEKNPEAERADKAAPIPISHKCGHPDKAVDQILKTGPRYSILIKAPVINVKPGGRGVVLFLNKEEVGRAIVKLDKLSELISVDEDRERALTALSLEP